MKSTVELNIGHNVAGEPRWTGGEICQSLGLGFPCHIDLRFHHNRVADSGEVTSCLELTTERALTKTELNDALHLLCAMFRQEAIAARMWSDGQWTEVLVGPKAEAWGGAFNADHWLAALPDCQPEPAANVLGVLRSEGVTIPGWTMSMSPTELRGSFERDRDGTGGGLWFEVNEAGQLELIDYDGVFALPKPVLRALRSAGVNAGRDFE